MNESWIIEFEKKYSLSIPNKYGTKRNPFLMFDCDGGIVNMPYEELKSFISQLLQKERERVVEGIENKRPDVCDCSKGKYECEHWGRHELIDEILSIINPQQNGTYYESPN